MTKRHYGNYIIGQVMAAILDAFLGKYQEYRYNNEILNTILIIKSSNFRIVWLFFWFKINILVIYCIWFLFVLGLTSFQQYFSYFATPNSLQVEEDPDCSLIPIVISWLQSPIWQSSRTTDLPQVSLDTFSQ